MKFLIAPLAYSLLLLLYPLQVLCSFLPPLPPSLLFQIFVRSLPPCSSPPGFLIGSPPSPHQKKKLQVGKLGGGAEKEQHVVSTVIRIDGGINPDGGGRGHLFHNFSRGKRLSGKNMRHHLCTFGKICQTCPPMSPHPGRCPPGPSRARSCVPPRPRKTEYRTSLGQCRRKKKRGTHHMHYHPGICLRGPFPKL